MEGRCECYQCVRTPVQLVRTDADKPDPRDARIDELEAEVARLTAQLDELRKGPVRTSTCDSITYTEQRADEARRDG